MSLESLNDELHSRNAHIDRTRLTEPALRSEAETAAQREAFQKTESWQPKFEEKNDIYLISPERARRKKLLFWVGGGLLVLLLVGAGTFFGVKYFLSNDQVDLAINGPREAASAEKVTYALTYTNGNRAALKDAKLLVTFPDNFLPDAEEGFIMEGSRGEKALGEVLAGQGGTQSISGTFFGPKGDSGILRATLRYIPTGSSSAFETAAEFSVTIATSPLTIEIEAPRELGSGQELDYVVTYHNTSPKLLSGVHLKILYPGEFTFLSANPAPENGQDDWLLGDLAPNQTGKIVVHGALNGNPNENKGIVALVGVIQNGTLEEYARAEQGTRIIMSPLAINQTVNDQTSLTVLPGDNLLYRLSYKNQGQIGLRQVVITQSIDTAFLDVSRLKLSSGAYDASQKKIFWRAADIPELAELTPGETGEITFTIPVLASFTLGQNDQKTIAIRSVATIDSPDIQTPLGQNKVIASNVMQVKLGALVGLTVLTSYDDERLRGSGPVPPVVGQETIYTLAVRLENSSNDLTESRVTMLLPSSVAYVGRPVPEDVALNWNERTHELSWDAGTLSPGKPKQFLFQVSITPNASQAGRSVVLVSKATFTGKERFTGRAITVARDQIDNAINTSFESAKDGTVRNP